MLDRESANHVQIGEYKLKRLQKTSSRLFWVTNSSLKRSAFYLRYQPKAERVQRLSVALHFAKIWDSGFSRNALGFGLCNGATWCRHIFAPTRHNGRHIPSE